MWTTSRYVSTCEFLKHFKLFKTETFNNNRSCRGAIALRSSMAISFLSNQDEGFNAIYPHFRTPTWHLVLSFHWHFKLLLIFSALLICNSKFAHPKRPTQIWCMNKPYLKAKSRLDSHKIVITQNWHISRPSFYTMTYNQLILLYINQTYASRVSYFWLLTLLKIRAPCSDLMTTSLSLSDQFFSDHHINFQAILAFYWRLYCSIAYLA